MSAVSNIPRELQDSIRDALDRRVKLSIKRMVRQETRSDKVENKILAFSACRLFILTAKVPCKVDSSVHYLDIQAFESKRPNQLSITVGDKTHVFSTLESDTDEVNHMITHVGTSVKQIFPAFPLERIIKQINVTPPERLKVMHDMMREIEKRDPGPCGGFSHMYACMCDYHLLPYREEVSWDVDTIYLSQDSKELCLKDFDHLDGRDLVPVVSALEHNPWFTKLNANNVKLVPEALSEVLKMMKKNSVIEELHMSNTGIRAEFVQKLSVAVLSNIGSQLSKIDLSHNVVEDRGILHLTGALVKLSKGLEYLNLSKTALTGKGISKLAEALTSSKAMTTSLKTLILSDNSVKGEDSATPSLFNFLAQPNAITHLDLSNTEVSLDGLCAALLRGCLQSLIHLNLANNTFTQKKMKEVFIPPSWKKFFASAYSLQSLNLSGNKLTPDTIKELLLGISSNVDIQNVHLDLSSNDLRVLGSRVIEGCIPPNTNITSLDISDNGFEQEMISLLSCIQQNTGLKKLAIGRNFTGVKAKHLGQVLEAVVQMIQDEDSTIECLSLADSKLRGDTAMVINALGSNTSLTELDISGNLMGDFGARMLAKALQINTKLRTVIWDRNGTSVQGFEDVASAMEKNYTLRKMPIPVNDATAALKVHTEKTETALQKIEVLLQRNHSPRKFSSDQAYRLQQGFLISSTQQLVDRLVVQVTDTVNALTMSPADSIQDDLDMAGNFISDADKSRQLLPRLQQIAIKSQDVGNPVQTKLNSMAQELRSVLERHLQQTVDEMLTCADKQCEAVMEDKTFQTDLKDECKKKGALPKDFTKLLLDGVETDISNKLSESNLSVAAHVSDRVMDEVIENLSKTHKTLTNHLNVQKSALKRETSRTTKDKKEQENEKMTITEEDKAGGKTESPRLSNKRKSLAQQRKQRPQSVIDRKVVDALVIEETLSGENNSFAVSPIGDTIEEEAQNGRPAERIEIGSLDSMPELSSVQKLQHINKDRPRRPKKTAVTRPMAKPTNLVEDGASMTNSFYESKPVEGFTANPARQMSKTDINENERTPVSSTKQEKKKWSPFQNKEKGQNKDKEKEKKEKDKGASSKTGFASSFSNLFSKVKTTGNHGNKPGSAEKKPLEEQKSVEAHGSKAEKKPSFNEGVKSNGPLVVEDKVDIGASGKDNQSNGFTAAVTSSPVTTTTSEEADKSSPPPYTGPKLPPGRNKPGLGGGLLAEMKTQKRFTVRQPPDGKPDGIDDPEDGKPKKETTDPPTVAVTTSDSDKPKMTEELPKATKELPKQPTALSDSSKGGSEPSKQTKALPEGPKAEVPVDESKPEKTEVPEVPKQKVALVPPSKRPTPKPRNKPPSVVKEEEEASTVVKRMSRPAPPPISSKPRPSVKPRSPANSMRNSDTDVKVNENAAPKLETPTPSGISGVVYDSSTLRLSVKGKIKKLGLEKKIDEEKEVTPAPTEKGREKKASSEPRDTPPPLSEPTDRPTSMFASTGSSETTGIAQDDQEEAAADGSPTNGVTERSSGSQSDEQDSAETGKPPGEGLNNKGGTTKSDESSTAGQKGGSGKRASLAEEEVIYI